MSNEIEIKVSDVEVEKPYVLIGLPDVGLIGVISASQLIKALDMKPIGSIDSDQLPPISVIHKAKPMSPLRVYGAGNVLLVVSEIPVPPALIRAFSREVVKWAKTLNPAAIISLAGIPVQSSDRMDLEQPSVYMVTSDLANDMLAELESMQVQKLEEGFMAGPYASILNYSIAETVPNITFLVQAHQNYPDPGAAAVLLETIATYLNIEIDVEPLTEQAEEIRLRMRDVMQRTRNTMDQVGKGQEYEIPAFYG